MRFVRFHPWLALLAGAVVVALPGAFLRVSGPVSVTVSAPGPIARLLEELKKECDPDSITNEYHFSTTAQPTELRRGQILAALVKLDEPALAEVRRRVREGDASEFGEMLQVAVLSLGDTEAVDAVAKLMVYSDYPAVRICAARQLRKIKNPNTEPYFLMALKDVRLVRNDACGTSPGPYYPVRTIAALSLRELGVPESTVAAAEPDYWGTWYR